MQLTDKIYYVGVNDRTKHRFEGQWHLPQGVSYNSYLVVDEKVALIDTVEADFFLEFLDKLHVVLGDRKIDYLVINHMEPDHSGSISLLRKYYPDVKLVGNKKTFDMVEGFYGVPTADDVEVTEGTELSLGSTTLRFHLVPMLHWPETMVSYLKEDKVLFSGDVFGCFGALNGNIVDRNMDTESYLPEMERYYAAILGKYGTQVLAGLKKLAPLEIEMICSTHGPVWTEHISTIIELYRRLGAGETEEGIVVAYGSMYGNTQRVAEAIAEGAAEAGVRKIVVHNLSVSQPSYVLRDIFRYKGLAIGGPTYNSELFPVVNDMMERLCGRKVSNHVLAAFGGFSWAGQAVKILEKYNERMKMEMVDAPVEWKQGANPDVLERARELGRRLAAAVKA